jgi:integrase
VSAGEDPSTGERIVLVDSVEIEGQGERADRVAYRVAEKLRTKLLSDADELKVARTRATVGALLERWMQQHEIDPTVRCSNAPSSPNEPRG